MLGSFGFRTDVGKERSINEDSCIAIKNKRNAYFLAVADGIGGHQRGDYASRIAINLISKSFLKRIFLFGGFGVRIWMHLVSNKANRIINNKSFKDKTYEGMGTTLCMAVIFKNKIYCLNIGDSRCYKVYEDSIELVSEDDSVVEMMVKTGGVNKEEADKHPDRNIITNALGIYPTLNYQIKTLNFDCNGLMICSDGLYSTVNKEDMEKLLIDRINISRKIDSLIDAANFNGGTDNISVSYFERES